jgi:hypothetical protein
MIFQQNPDDEDYYFMKEREKASQDAASLQRERQVSKNIKKLQTDKIDVAAGLHEIDNISLEKPMLRRKGLSTPGTAYVSNGGIQFNYDHSIVDLRLKSHKTVNGVHHMKTPKPMKLSVDFGNKHSHVSGFEINVDVNPQNFRLDHKKIKDVKIAGVMTKMNTVAERHKQKINSFGTSFNKETLLKSSEKKNKEEINDLSKRLSGFIHSQKKQKKENGVKLTAGNNLDFSIVGITTGLLGKKKRGVEL